MALFQKKIGTVFLKEESDATGFINRMVQLEEQVADKYLKNEINKQIKLASIGEVGEKNISFELKNSGMDMYVLHDIYLEIGDLSAQIDYLVITRKMVFVIECKNLIGDIEIDNQGNFIRKYEMFGKKIKEGIYSPITQNQRHLEILKKVRRESKSNFLMKAAFEHYFDQNYKSLVVLANPKTVLNAKYAKKDIKEQVIRADQLISKIKEVCANCNESDMTEKEMLEIAQFFLTANKAERSDYARKYEEIAIEAEKQQREKTEVIQEKEESIKSPVVQDNKEKSKICPKCGNELILRTATKGANVGNKFYGCSSFPKCRYIENV